MKDNKKPSYKWTYHDTKLLLKKYRDIVWNIENRVFDVEAEYNVMGGKRLAEVLDYLDDYTSGFEKKKLEERISSMQKSKWLIEIVDKAILKVKSYPANGECFYNILYNQYVGKNRCSEKEMIDLLNIERTTFYKRKREAIELMSVILWGYCKLISEDST